MNKTYYVVQETHGGNLWSDVHEYVDSWDLTSEDAQQSLIELNKANKDIGFHNVNLRIVKREIKDTVI